MAASLAFVEGHSADVDLFRRTVRGLQRLAATSTHSACDNARKVPEVCKLHCKLERGLDYLRELSMASIPNGEKAKDLCCPMP
jgi:hypothetical protein